MSAKQYDYIALGMPMPVDVFATIGELFDKAWPGAEIITDLVAAGVPSEIGARFGSSFGGPKFTVIRLPKKRRRTQAITKKDAQAIAETNAREAESDDGRLSFHGFSETGGVEFSGMPEELQVYLGAIGKEILDAAPDEAINYLEWQVVDKPSGVRTVICVARSKGQTAHAMRRKAEAKIERALERLEKVDPTYDGPYMGDLATELRALLR